MGLIGKLAAAIKCGGFAVLSAVQLYEKNIQNNLCRRHDAGRFLPGKFRTQKKSAALSAEAQKRQIT
jgi:hypothetical protein